MELETEIQKIIDRNERVEADKSWETSWQRKLVIAAITYITVVAFMLFCHFPNPFIGAIIPVIGYVLSTLTLSFVRAILRK